MIRGEQDTFDGIIDRYNAGVEPLENWATADIVEAVRLLDAELQRRYDDRPVHTVEEIEEEDDFDFDDDDGRSPF